VSLRIGVRVVFVGLVGFRCRPVLAACDNLAPVLTGFTLSPLTTDTTLASRTVSSLCP